VSPEQRWTNLTNGDLLLSLRVPTGWGTRAPDEFHFSLFNDRADEGGYRANVNFLLGEPEQPGRDWFDAFRAAAPGHLAATISGYELLGVDAFELSSPGIVQQVCFRQSAEGAPPTSHIQAYLWAGSFTMYVIDAATLRPHEGRDLPVFAEIINSIRLLPARP
jgi:hypothetical protein